VELGRSERRRKKRKGEKKRLYVLQPRSLRRRCSGGLRPLSPASFFPSLSFSAGVTRTQEISVRSSATN